VPVYEYTMVTDAGRQQRSVIDAESAADARRKLRAAGARVLHVSDDQSSREVGTAVRPAYAEMAPRRLNAREVAAATRQLATLLRGGMALVPALAALHEQLGHRPLGVVFGRVHDRVGQGATLAVALREHPRAFSDLYVNLVAAGEASGALEAVLLRLADVLEKRVLLANKLRAALAYPLFLAVIGGGVIVFLLSFVVPGISKLFLEMNRTLPLPTRALIAVSGFLASWLWLLAVIGIAAFFGLRAWFATAAGRLLWDRTKLRLPLFGGIVVRVSVARFARTLGVLLASGAPVLDALDIAKRVAGNAALASALDGVREAVRHGGGLAEPLRRCGVFPSIVYHMVAVGESSGTVEDALLNVADAYDADVEASVAALASVIEPLMIPIMGGIVGFIVLAILLPIFEINQAIR